jgi:hypothetical protein
MDWHKQTMHPNPAISVCAQAAGFALQKDTIFVGPCT